MALSRRDLFRAAPAAALPLFVGRVCAADPPFPGMTVRMQEPTNLEYPISSLRSWLTPNEQFYVRCHFAAPKLDPANWKLTVEGEVENRVELTLADLRALPAVTRPVTLECAGNNRGFLVPPGRGVPWGPGAVSNAEWTGVPLSAILDKAKVKAGAVEVVLVGADRGTVAESPGAIHFDRSLPLAKARKPEVLLAYKMNGADLPALHGAPVRAVVGGWYGVASVKWLTKLIVTAKPHTGFWQTIDYSYFRRVNGLPEVVPVTTMQPKAAIARPALHEVVPAGKPYTMTGVAWTGEEKLAKVEVSADGGKTWETATLTGKDEPFCWRLWEYTWKVPAAAGTAKLLARATAADGTTQPEKHDPDRRAYMINYLVPVEVLIR
ncbi:MAG TPA: sulfite oxidase [Fimbriiglobus sp.]|nr:sulfite oxidase [Fimbriiglobus sp.]